MSSSPSNPWTDEIGRRLRSRTAALVAAGLAWAAFGFQAYGHTYGQVSVLDEGLYLVKGWLYVTGVYRPFQDFGPLTNHMPLSFLIPGWVQALAGPGIATGRGFAWGLGLLAVLGLWLATRRLAGAWWAAGVVWLVALNSGLIKIYSQAISEGLIVCMLIWTVALGVGPGRRLWQTTLAAGLAGMIGLTRINMMPVVFFLVAYTYWAHGRKAGHAGLAAGVGVLAVGQGFFMPGILKLWAKWLPAALTPFLDPFRQTGGGQDAWEVQLALGSKFGILVDSLRLHFAASLGVVWAWLAWPGRSTDEAGRQRLKAAALLSAMFVFLLALHVWASLGLTYCPYCLKNYMAFFSPIGLIAAAVAGAHWLPALSARRRGAALFLVPAAVWGAGLSLGPSLSDQLISWPLPRLSGGRVLPGTSAVGTMIEAKLGWTADKIVSLLNNLQWVALAAVLLSICALAVRRRRQSQPSTPSQLASQSLAVLAVIAVLAASFSFGSGYHGYDCGADVVGAEAAAGSYLRQVIPPGSAIYWNGDQSPVPLLYLDRPALFAPQLNGIYSYRYGGDADLLAQNGYWNPTLAQRWLTASEFVLVSQDAYSGWLAGQLSPAKFDQISPSPPTNPCDPGSALLIFHRLAPATP